MELSLVAQPAVPVPIPGLQSPGPACLATFSAEWIEDGETKPFVNDWLGVAIGLANVT